VSQRVLYQILYNFCSLIYKRSSGGFNNAGLGQTRAEELKEGDDEYEAYRKRMMMAYRFRPNPLVIL
jgi:hypothetical protein